MGEKDAATPPYALDVDPVSELTFALTSSSSAAATNDGTSTARVTLTLQHSGETDEHLAFKIKTTQPKRYLVRPNQGLVAPNASESISILLVEKEKQALLQSFFKLGQTGLDANSKDKFLVQSCAVSRDFAKKYQETKSSTAATGTSKEVAEALTSFWNAISSSPSASIYNKKLSVRHVGGTQDEEISRSLQQQEQPNHVTSSSAAAPPSLAPPAVSMEQMSPEQMYAELSTLRRKYDELVSFSVNLTAERDVLNNTLEQTKRDLNREVANKGKNKDDATARSNNVAAANSSLDGAKGNSKMLQILCLVCFLLGIRLGHTGNFVAGLMSKVPIVGGLIVPPAPAVVVAEPEPEKTTTTTTTTRGEEL